MLQPRSKPAVLSLQPKTKRRDIKAKRGMRSSDQRKYSRESLHGSATHNSAGLSLCTQERKKFKEINIDIPHPTPSHVVLACGAHSVTTNLGVHTTQTRPPLEQSSVTSQCDFPGTANRFQGIVFVSGRLRHPVVLCRAP